MDSMHLAAVVKAITIESRSLAFYRAAAAKVGDAGTRHIFNRLAVEEAEHLEAFCNLFQDDWEVLASAINEAGSTADNYYPLLLDLIDGSICEQEALLFALREEEYCLDRYRMFEETIRDDLIHSVFSRSLSDTRKHCEMIKTEYVRLMYRADQAGQALCMSG